MRVNSASAETLQVMRGVGGAGRDGDGVAACGTVALQHHQHGPEQDCQIDREASMAEIPEIVRELRSRLAGAGGIALANLSPARQARLDEVPTRPVGKVLAQV